MAGSSVEDVAYAPVMNPEADADVSKVGFFRRFNLLHLVLCIVLFICIVFQFIAIVTPGWKITSTDGFSGYESVFYSTLCIDDECETRSYRDEFYSSYKKAKDEGKPALALQYNLRVLYQLNVQIPWFLIIATLVFQAYKLFKPQEAFPRATTINIVVLATACPFMFQVLYKNFVEIDYSRKLSDNDIIDISVGFPYSLFFYAATFAVVIACLVLTVKQIIDQVREKDRLHAEFKVKFDRLRLEYDAEVDAFRRYRQKHHLRPDSGGSYRGDRRSPGDNRSGSHSPRHSHEIRDHDRDYRKHDDHSPRRPDDFQHGRHSPRPRDRSPPRGHNHGNRSPRPHYRNHSPQRHDNGSHSPRNRSPRPDDIRIRRHSPPRNDSSSSSLPERNDDKNNSSKNLGEHDNPAVVVTPPSEAAPKMIIEPPAGHNLENENDNAAPKEGAGAKTEDIELSDSNFV